jgi:hypothetical protein
MSSRVTVIDTPVADPGVCCLCGTAGGDNRKFVDFGKQLDWYGAVYFCETCFAEMSEALGFIPVAKFDELHLSYRNLVIENDRINQKFGKLLNAFRGLLDDESADIPESNSDPVDIVEESNRLLESIGQAANRDSEVDESSSVEGSDDLFDASDFDK